VSAPGAEALQAATLIRRFVSQLGPGLIWAMVAIGQTHVSVSEQIDPWTQPVRSSS
jgi:hypothetical protein